MSTASSSFDHVEEGASSGNGCRTGVVFPPQEEHEHQREQRMRECNSPCSPQQQGSQDMYEQSEMSRVTQCGSLCGLHESASGVRLYVKKESYDRRNNVGIETRHLNQEALSMLERVVAAGVLPLRSELLGKDLVCLKNLKRHGESMSLLSNPEETEVSVDGLATHTKTDAIPYMYTSNERESLVDTSATSVRSVCGSCAGTPLVDTDTPFASNVHRNDDFSSLQVNVNGSVMSTDHTYMEGAKSSVVIPESFKNDAGASFPVETDYTAEKSFIDQTDLTLLSEQLQGCDATDSFCEKSKPRASLGGSLLNQENLDTLKRQIASGQCILRDGVLAELGITLLPRPDGSQSMMVEFPATVSQTEESLPQREIASSREYGKACSRFEETHNVEAWDDGNDQRSILDQMLDKLRSMELERANIISELADLREDVHERTLNLTSLLQLTDAKRLEFQKQMEENFSKVTAQITQSGSQLSAILGTELDALKQNHVDELQSLKTNFDMKLEDLLRKTNDRLSKFDELTDLLLIQQEKLQKQVDHAYQVEALPPNGDVPDGKRVRFVIEVQIYGECREVLLPMSVKATVGMCKREILRRIRHQGLIDDDIRYSNVVLLHGTYTLFEEDVLSDVLFPILQEEEEEKADGSCVKLKLHVINVRNDKKLTPHVPKIVEENKESIPFKSKPSSTAEYTLQPVDTLVLGVELADDLTQNESLGRRLVWELERMERETLLQNERVRHVVIAKDALSRTRAALLDRATHSPVDAHRRAARSALARLDVALGPCATVEELGLASSMAAATLRSITGASGEDERVDVLLEARRLEEERKQRLVGEIERLSEEVGKKLRIPVGFMRRAESLTQDAQRAIILAPSMTINELSEICKSMEDFCTAIRSHN